ncbi:nuclear receptor 2C2-associated protein-like [Mya arenaria]|uniref:nuclear receptor 2C2-associated protein-like n=1 Tax=Mya arenaria TaxID=6604 RepID=UPI0022DFCB52|nr:nuclear receptor 2C2-associated protein-like [Mya arenaria]
MQIFDFHYIWELKTDIMFIKEIRFIIYLSKQNSIISTFHFKLLCAALTVPKKRKDIKLIMSHKLDIAVSNIRVSSVLNRDTKQFGKKHLVDSDDDTCWNSDQGSPQWISMEFDQMSSLTKMQLQFQGGFAGRECWLEGRTEGSAQWAKVRDFFPDDINGLQTFSFDPPTEKLQAAKIVFSTSTDFFGRITIYSLVLYGSDS